MEDRGIIFILIQIDEAHSSAWPIALEDQPEPHKNIEERIARASDFVTKNSPPFPVYVDMWSNEFAETYHAWPDKYCCIDADYNIISMSKYGSEGANDALIENDCVDMILWLSNE